MPRKASDLTVLDQFCGAGGSSIGAEMVGLRLQLAMNHWKRAIETHSENFPHADHVCADISSTDPRCFPSTHVLLTSPECVNHSQAKTRKERATLFDPHGADAAERSRATMMDVPRYAEYHGYEIIVVENVCEVARWSGFVPWLQWMRNLGYEHQFVSLNSLIAWPTPQSRDRLYIVFHRQGNPAPDLRFDPPSWCPACEAQVAGVQTFKRGDRRIGKYRQQYDYRCPTCFVVVYPYAYPALTAIDWSLATQRIGDRKRPLADATRRRVEVGLERFGRPAIIQAAGHTWEAPGSGYVRAWSVSDPIPAQTATLSHGVAVPAWMVLTSRSNDARDRIEALDQPTPTQTGRNEWGVAFAPFITHAGARVCQPRSAADTMPTPTAKPGHAVVIPPFIAELRGGNSDARSVEEPLATMCASGQHHALVTPRPAFFVKNFTASHGETHLAKAITEPLGTVTTSDHHSLVEMPFLTSYYGTGGVSPVADPVPTVTTRDRHALVEPHVTVDDCGFRMLEPHEIQRAMAFPDDYVVTGNKREKVRQLGNAVTSPVMKMLLERCVETLL